MRFVSVASILAGGYTLMALPKQKERKPPKARDGEKANFDPYWNGRSGKVDTLAEYIDTACREPRGFFRGAKIR